MHPRHHGEATGDQVWSSKTKVLCMPSPPQADNVCTCSLLVSFSKRHFSKCATFRLMSLLEMPSLQHAGTTDVREYQDLHISSVVMMLREVRREVNTGRPFESRLHMHTHTHQ